MHFFPKEFLILMLTGKKKFNISYYIVAFSQDKSYNRKVATMISKNEVAYHRHLRFNWVELFSIRV